MDLETSTPQMENSGWAMKLYTISRHKVCVGVLVCLCLDDRMITCVTLVSDF